MGAISRQTFLLYKIYQYFRRFKLFWIAILHLLFPYPCDVCGKILLPGDSVHGCYKCFLSFCSLAVQEKIDFNHSFLMDENAKICFSYKDKTLVKKLLLFAKFGRDPSYINLLSDIILDSCKNFLLQFHSFLPVPSHQHNTKSRMFCLVYSVTQSLAYTLNKCFCPDVYINPNNSLQQKSFSFKDRIQNAPGKFLLQKNLLLFQSSLPAKVLVFDDIVTSGATLNAVVSLLQNHISISHIGVFAFAKTP